MNLRPCVPRRRRATTCVIVAAATAVLSSATPAVAQTPKDKSRAMSLLKDGAALLDRREHAAALEKFEQAFALVPSPKIQFNFGLAYEGLARNAQAYRAFQRYLDEAPNEPADRRKQAGAHVQSLRTKVLFVNVTADADAATVSIDGIDEGKLPLAAPIALEPGPHQVVVRGGGGTPWTKAVSGDAGAVLNVNATLSQPPPPSLASSSVADREAARPLPQAADPTVSESATASAGEEASSRPLYAKPWFWVAIGVVAAAAVVGTVVALSSGGGVQYQCPADVMACNPR